MPNFKRRDEIILCPGQRKRKVSALGTDKDNLSLLIRLLREGKEDRIVIYNGDIPVAEIRAYQESEPKVKLFGTDKKAKMSKDFNKYLPDEFKDLG